jgi:hypothetical protein
MPSRLSILALFYRAMADEPLFSSGKERSVQLPGAMSAWQVHLEEPERGSDGLNTFDCENNLLRRGRTIWLRALFVFPPRPESCVDYVVTGGST